MSLDARIFRSLAVVLAVFLLSLPVQADPLPEVLSYHTPVMQAEAPSYALDVLRAVNAFRKQHGLPPLHLEPRLTRAAQAHSDYMARNRVMSHTGAHRSDPGDRVSQAGYPWRSVAENVAAGQRSPEEVVRAWSHSPGHRANLLSPDATDMGVGFNNLYWTLNVARSR